MKKEKKGLLRFVPLPAFCVLCFFLLALCVHIVSFISTPFADFFNETISPILRMILAKATGWLPFSLGETILVSLPVLFVVILVCYFTGPIKRNVSSIRFLVSVFSVVTLMYSIFVLNYGIGYQNSGLDEKLGIPADTVSAKELYDTALLVNGELEELLPEIDFTGRNGASVMPYSLDVMNERLNDAYAVIHEQYPFISSLRSNIKYIALSVPMTYTHISGVYSYYTGEANLNINFPDYSLAYTAAHEFAHQRGIAPEDEANFTAFLVCTASEDAYLRYCGYENMLEYLMNALYSADAELYSELVRQLDRRVISEISAFNSFFEEYRDSAASTVSKAISDAYLKSQGESEGERSYGMVVDLAVAYYAAK